MLKHFDETPPSVTLFLVKGLVFTFLFQILTPAADCYFPPECYKYGTTTVAKEYKMRNNIIAHLATSILSINVI